MLLPIKGTSAHGNMQPLYDQKRKALKEHDLCLKVAIAI